MYDDDPASINLISACLTPEELGKLLDQGAIFDSVVFLNGEGQEHLSRLMPLNEDDDNAYFPYIRTITIERIDHNSIPIIHSIWGNRRARGFFAMGG